MTLIRWDPVRELNSLQDDVNRIFSSYFDQGSRQVTRSAWLPAMDLVEESDEFVVRADLPGLSESDVNVEFEDDVLTISGNRSARHEQKQERYYRIERSHGEFSRSLTLPAETDPDKITADFRDGVLELHIPKPERRKPRRLSIFGRDRNVIEAGDDSESSNGKGSARENAAKNGQKEPAI